MRSGSLEFQFDIWHVNEGHIFWIDPSDDEDFARAVVHIDVQKLASVYLQILGD